MIQMTITLHDDGRLEMRATTPDTVICYGLLELAKDAVRAQSQGGPKSGIVPAKAMPRNGNAG